MNFGASILLLKMKENIHFQHIMLYYFKKVKKATKMQQKISAVSGEAAAADEMCHEWFVKFLGTTDISAK